MQKCIKCNSIEIAVTYKKKGYIYSTVPTTQGQYIDYIDNKYIVNEEHLFCNCRNCGFGWREDTQDVKNIKQVEAEAKLKDFTKDVPAP